MNIKSNYCAIVILLGFQDFMSEHAAYLLLQAVSLSSKGKSRNAGKELETPFILI